MKRALAPLVVMKARASSLSTASARAFERVADDILAPVPNVESLLRRTAAPMGLPRQASSKLPGARSLAFDVPAIHFRDAVVFIATY